MELAFAGLHQLCAPMLDGLGALPSPQQDALRVAFGMQDGAAPDRFIVALASLSLLAGAAEVEPLVCLVDDVQWLDRASAQTLAFVARRLLAERIAIVFSVREPNDINELTGLPELVVRGLADSDARSLLASAMPGRLDERVRDQIVAETRGNPLALLELPRGLTPAELAGGFALPDARPLASRVEETFVQRVRALPRETQRLLLVAAAEPVGDVSLLWRAADRLGIRGDAGKPAEGAALIDLGIRVRFRHPLVRSAAYRAADFHDRQEVHRALADATDPDTDPDRRAWHRAQAASAPDETVAAELERSADRAQARGGAAAAAAFLARAAELTPDPAGRGRRAVAAAQAKFDVGASDAALELVATAELAPLDELAARAVGAVARGDRVRPDARQRRTGALVRCCPAPRAARRRDGSRDPSRSDGGGDVRRSPRRQAGRPRDCRSRSRCAGGPAAAPRDRPAPRWPGDKVHRGLRGRRAAAAEGPRRLPPRGGIDGTRRALALAGLSAGAGSLGRRALVRAGDARAAGRARGRHAARAPYRGHLSRVPPHSCGSVRPRFGADRGSRRDRRRDRPGTAEARVGDAGRVARQRGRGPRADRDWDAPGESARRGHGAGGRRLGRCTAVQRPRPLRRGARGRSASLRIRRCRALRVGPRGADRGRRSERRDGRSRRRARPPERAHPGQRHRLGARHRGRLTRAAEQRARCGAPLPRGGRAARAQPWRGAPRPRPPHVRRMAASREPARRRARAASSRL